MDAQVLSGDLQVTRGKVVATTPDASVTDEQVHSMGVSSLPAGFRGAVMQIDGPASYEQAQFSILKLRSGKASIFHVSAAGSTWQAGNLSVQGQVAQFAGNMTALGDATVSGRLHAHRGMQVKGDVEVRFAGSGWGKQVLNTVHADFASRASADISIFPTQSTCNWSSKVSVHPDTSGYRKRWNYAQHNWSSVCRYVYTED